MKSRGIFAILAAQVAGLVANAHNAHAAMHDPDIAEMQRVARKLEHKRTRERLNRAAAERAMKTAAAVEGR